MGSCEEAEATEGRERRPRPFEVSLLSPVVPVEVLAEEECLRSVLDEGDSLRMLSSPLGTQKGSFVEGRSIAVCILYVECYLHQKRSRRNQIDIESCKRGYSHNKRKASMALQTSLRLKNASLGYKLEGKHTELVLLISDRRCLMLVPRDNNLIKLVKVSSVYGPSG